MIQTAIGSTQGLADTEKTEMENVLEEAPELVLALNYSASHWHSDGQCRGRL